MNPNPNQENFFYGLNPINVVSTPPFELLKVYGTKIKRMHVKENLTEQISNQIRNGPIHEPNFTAAIMKLAKSRLEDMKSKNVDVFSILSKSGQVGQLTYEEEIDLGIVLQASMEQVAKRKFVSARKLLNWCQSSSSKIGTPLQRIVYYFSEALQLKMDQEWGFIAPNGKTEKDRIPVDVAQTLITLLPARMSCEQEFFTTLVSQYTSIQSILDSVSSSKRIHLIDFRIKNGSHWILLIQALAVRYECPVELFKITAIGTSKKLLKETGKRLSAFAQTMNVPLAYNVVLSDLKDIKNDMFKVEGDETLAIYTSNSLWSVLAWPNDLEKLICTMKGLNPCLMVIHEIDAALNSPDFVERCTQTLFHLSCLFDGLQVYFENHLYRKLSEEIHHRDRIRNAITCDGIERIYRLESASFWRSLFGKCGFVEAELSPSALSQAYLLLGRSVNRNLLHIESDGKCMIAGWGGTRLEFVSIWRLH